MIIIRIAWRRILIPLALVALVVLFGHQTAQPQCANGKCDVPSGGSAGFFRTTKSVVTLNPFETRIGPALPHQQIWATLLADASMSDLGMVARMKMVQLEPRPLNVSVTPVFDSLTLEPDDIVLCMAASGSRVNIMALCRNSWDGPAVVGVYCDNDACVTDILAQLPLLTKNPNTAVLLVRAHGSHYYPINAMRNILTERIPNDEGYGIFILDSDFVLSTGSYAVLRAEYARAKADDRQRLLVVPCFEFGADSYDVTADTSNLPRNKGDMLESLARNSSRPSKWMIYAAGHSCTEYERWAQGSDVAAWPQSTYHEDYEPFYIVEKTARFPGFNEWFTFWGGDKQSHCFLLWALGYRYWTVPSVFGVHHPHQMLLSKATDLEARQREINRQYLYMLRRLIYRHFKIPKDSVASRFVGMPKWDATQQNKRTGL